MIKETSCGSKGAETQHSKEGLCPFLCHSKSGSFIVFQGDEITEITEEVPLRPLTSLKWPYLPEESAYQDPLKRDDPKPLQTAQYEAIGSRNF
jgi:hypothetical protein